MTLTIEQIKNLLADFTVAKDALRANLQDVPETPDFYDDEYDRSHSVADIVRELRTHAMPPEALAMHQQLVTDLETFTKLINEKVVATSNNNARIHDAVDKLTQEFLAAVRVPEIDLGAALIINKKTIDPEDYEALIAAYRELGFRNYTIKAQNDTVYYNPNNWHFNTLKDLLFAELPRNLQKKYPTLLNYIQNSVVNTNPLHGRGLFQVMEARKE